MFLDISEMLHPEDGPNPPQFGPPSEVLGAAPAGSDFPTEGSPPFINRMLSVEQWRDYVAGYDFGRIAPSRLVLHHTYIPDEPAWKGLATMRGMQRFYAGKGWTSAPHIYAGPDGIWLATPMSRVGIHAGTGNGSVAQGWYSIGLEMVGFFDNRPPAGRVWEHTVAVMGELARRLKIPPRQLISFHRDYTNQKSCPGWKVTKEWVFAQVESYQAATAPTQPGTPSTTIRAYRTVRPTVAREAPAPGAPVAWGGTCQLQAGEVLDLTPSGTAGWMHWAAAGFIDATDIELVGAPAGIYTELSPIIGSPPVNELALADAFFERCQRAGSPYCHEKADPIRRVIVPETIRLCRLGRVDVYEALAQCGHESGWLVSALSQRTDKDGRPLRNGYGIGVYERKDRATPQWRPGTVWDADVQGYRPAVGFTRWENSVLAQVGRLVAYATEPGKRTPEQQQLVDAALKFRGLELRFHGSAPQLKQLGKAHNPRGEEGAGWAAPGFDYGHKLAEKARGLFVESR